jgi:hypothetical protein
MDFQANAKRRIASLARKELEKKKVRRRRKRGVG